MLQCFS